MVDVVVVTMRKHRRRKIEFHWWVGCVVMGWEEVEQWVGLSGPWVAAHFVCEQWAQEWGWSGLWVAAHYHLEQWAQRREKQTEMES